MNAICGQLGETSSPSAALQLSLESRLRRRLDGLGSPLFVLTWKHWAMPSGPPICALRASARRIDVSAFIGGQLAPCGWSTPLHRDYKDGPVAPNTPINGFLGRQVWQITGQTLSGRYYQTVQSARLNPAFSRWLMGLPTALDGCDLLATR